jgi:hypothetical protein
LEPFTTLPVGAYQVPVAPTRVSVAFGLRSVLTSRRETSEAFWE